MAKPLATPTRLRVPAHTARTDQVLAPLRLLSLTGGGYRGIFTGEVLVRLCAATKCEGSLEDVFDVFAGTSIGGLIACALAVGIAPRTVLQTIEKHGGRSFRRSDIGRCAARSSARCTTRATWRKPSTNASARRRT